MPRTTLKQQFPLLLALLAALYLATAVVFFVQLVAEHGFWAVVSEPIYPVASKPVIVLSNGEVWSRAKTFGNFLATAVLWMAMSAVLLKLRKWPGINA